ncbi:ankyrin repeat domain-containing protein 27-like [Lycorma delicatula]|uniref:ankyrin repeat domain-containing protein 27-like n=1 Tax=Lycorma delicatula TaxID=130591 RepID=UPI003F511888
MESNYDEDLNDNIFFQILQSDHYELFNKAIHDGWIICVPRAGSLPKYALAQEDLFSHILIPSDELPETHFRTLNDREVKICNRVVTVEPNDNSAPFSTHVLFEETFYDSELLKYKILCIENPLELYSDFHKEDVDSSVITVQTLRDCIDLLWIESAGKEILEKMDEAIKNFMVANDRLEYKSLQRQRDLVGGLYTNCLQITLQDSRLRSKTNSNKYLLQNIKTSVESYVHHAIYKKLIKGITACTAYEDANFNKIVRNLSDLQLRDLDVRLDLYDTVSKAKSQLSRVDGYCTVLGKIGCLRRTIAAISKYESPNISQGNVVTADDLLPILVFLVIKSGLPNWIAHLTYMKLFNFSASLSNQVDQNCFLLTTLEAAIEHIKSGLLLGPSEPEGQFVYEGITNDNGVKESIDISNSLNNLLKIRDTNRSSLSILFDLARQGKGDELKSILENSETDKERILLESDLSSKLCHPLCSCDNCERQISQNLCNTTPTIHSCDDRGYTVLHIASMHGKPKVVDVLLSCGANPDASDYSGSTPLHYASSRGHQNALLLLIHCGAAVDVIDNEGNMPLHLAAGNGHEACVKALLYFTEHIGVKIDVNSKNRHGETALHNAARWGYESIVKILLDYGANPTIENKRKLTPVDYAHSLHISCLLSSFTKKTIVNVKITKNEAVKQDVTVAAASTKELDFNDEDKSTNVDKKKMDVGIRPRTTDQIRLVERLLRAIAYGDIRLACFYLGLELPSLRSECIEKTHSCHPLCLCSKAVHHDLPESETDSRLTESVNVNVCNSEGYTPLHIAVMHGQVELVKMLLSAGAIINLRTRNKNRTALHIACENKLVQVAQLLLETDMCNINIQDSLGNTPLHYACMTKNTRLVELLLKFKPNLQVRNNTGKTPQEEAEEKMSLTLVRLLSNACTSAFKISV